MEFQLVKKFTGLNLKNMTLASLWPKLNNQVRFNITLLYFSLHFLYSHAVQLNDMIIMMGGKDIE